jgi:cyclase
MRRFQVMVTPVGQRGRIISFPELGVTNIYLILAPDTTYVCDTFLGPEPMMGVKALLEAEGRFQPFLVFNSHKDWDHVWGNCAFPEARIVATEECAANLREHFARELDQYGDMAQGEVVPAFPSLLFTGRLVFADDGVLLMATPGHTSGSASCLDMEDNVLYVGDNVESPVPHLLSSDLDAYSRTLDSYLTLSPTAIVTGHGGIETMTFETVRANLTYVRAMAGGIEVDVSGWSEYAQAVHLENVRRLANGLKRLPQA